MAAMYFALYFSKKNANEYGARTSAEFLSTLVIIQSAAWIASKVDFWVSSHLHSSKS